MNQMQPWNVRAVNLPEHANNPIHTDAGAQAAGFPRALVAGVTTYAYLMRPPCAAWGASFSDGGWATVRLASPVFDGDDIRVDVDGDRVTAVVDGEVKASARAGVGALPDDIDELPSADAPLLDGESIEPLERHIGPGSEWWRYTQRAGDDQPIHDESIAPATWLSLANELFHRRVVKGSWIHTDSVVQHSGAVDPDVTVRIEGSLIGRTAHRLGTFGIADVRLSIDETPVARIRHRALIELHDSTS